MGVGVGRRGVEKIIAQVVGEEEGSNRNVISRPESQRKEGSITLCVSWEFYILAISNVISHWVPTCDSAQLMTQLVRACRM